MPKYHTSSSIETFLSVLLVNEETLLLSSFEKEKVEEKQLNSILVFDKEHDIKKFFIDEFSMDIANLLNTDQKEYFKKMYSIGEENPLLFSVEISFDIDGFHTPGKFYGPPEDCYPEEYFESRHVTGCVIKLDTTPIQLTESNHSVHNQLFRIYDLFEKEINDVEIDPYRDFYQPPGGW